MDYNDKGMCTVNVHWHIGAEHRSGGQYDETAEFDHPNKDTYAGSHRRLASADGGMRIGHMCVKGKELWEAKTPSVRNTDGSVNEYDWKYCKDMHVGLTYEFHWPHSSLGACQTPWQYQYHFLDGVLCGATMSNLDIATAAAPSRATHGCLHRRRGPGLHDRQRHGRRGHPPDLGRAQRLGPPVRHGRRLLPGLDDGRRRPERRQRRRQVPRHGRPRHVARGPRVPHARASTMDEMCRRMLVISADDMSPDVAPHGARETVVAALTDPNEDPRTTRAASAAPTRRRRRPRPTDTSHKARLPAETAPHPPPPRWCRHAEATADVSTALDRLPRDGGAV